MLLGDKCIFAVECEIQNRFDSFVYCTFRFWIKGDPVGDWDEEVVLGVIVNAAHVFLRYENDRRLDNIDCSSSVLAWARINQISNSDDPEELRLSLERQYRQRYLLHEIADESVAPIAQVIVIDCSDGSQRILWKMREGIVIHEVVAPSLTVDRVLELFVQWAENRV